MKIGIFFSSAPPKKLTQLEKVGVYSFGSCPAIQELHNEKLTRIEKGTFINLRNAVSIDLPNVTYIGNWGLGNLEVAEYVNLPKLETMGGNVFLGAFLIESLDLPNLTAIGSNCFGSTYSLKELNVPKLSGTIGQSTFSSSALEYLDIPNVTGWESDVFGYCKLKRLEMSSVQSINNLPNTQNCIIAMPSTFKECTKNTAGRNYKIYGTKGTYAEQWANENGHEFIEISQETALLQDVPMEYTGDETLTVDVIGFNRTYQWYGNTVADNMTGTPIDGATDKDFHPAEYPAYPYYYCVVTSTDVGYDPVEIRTGKTLSETILNPMSSQIRFKRKADGSYAKMFDVRSRAEISDEDFAKCIAETNEEAITKISKAGFVYAPNSTDFSIEDAQKVAKGEKVSGYTDAPVSYIQDADGYYMFTCIVKDIPVKDVEQGVTAYAYICVEDKWYFYNAETTMNFKDLYDANYNQAATAYGW